MRDLWNDGSFQRILLIGLLIAFLGIAPLSKTVTAGFDRVRRFKEVNDPGMTVEYLAVVAEQQPWRSGFWEAAGDAALSVSDAQNAGIYYTQAAAKGELSPEGYLAWGDADWLAEKPKTALQIWKIASDVGVSKDEVFSRQAVAYRELGDDLALIETLQAMLSQEQVTDSGQPLAVSARYYEWGLLLAAYDPASAPDILSKAIELDPTLESEIGGLMDDIQQALSQGNPEYTLMISGRGLANLGKWGLAEKAFKNVVDMQPEYAEAWAYLGESKQHVASGVDPVVALETALDLDPDSISANAFMALYWQRQGNNERALEYLKDASKLDPDNPAYLVEMGTLVALLGDLEAGQDYFWQAIALSSNDPKYMGEFLKFSIRFNLNLRDVALPVARQLVISNPENPVSLDVMGELLLRLGDMLNAERFFLRALLQDPEYDLAHLHLGDLYRSQGKLNRSKYHYGRVLETSINAQIVDRAQEALEPSSSP